MSVFANKRSIVHKGDGLVQTCPTPDVCKTPSPGGPVPIPYINFAQDSALTGGSKTVKIEGNSIALKSSSLGISSGDEGGVAGGGIVSSKIKGKCTWPVASDDVQVEGEGVVRFLDTCLHNGNASNTGGQPALGSPCLTYGGDEKCSKCGAPAGHPIPSTTATEREAARVAESSPPSKTNDKGEEQGYMIGVMQCLDPSSGRTVMLRAASGKPAPPGFNSHPSPMPDPGGKPCAAPKLVAAAKALGFTPIGMTEQWQGPRRGPYKPGRHAESCDVCKKRLPAMMCNEPEKKK